MKRKGTGPDGLVVIDKPGGMTSHQVVSRMRRLAGTRKVGHAGTLDPMATGVLLVGIERATRLLGHLALTEKTYRATIRLGQSTVTDDAEGEVVASADATGTERSAIEAGMAELSGEIEQVPSKISAIKVDGRRAYSRVRSGEEIELVARPVTVSAFSLHELREVEQPDGSRLIDLDVTVDCSSGTYVRALARDLGTGLGLGGHLTALRRTRVGPYSLERAHTLEGLEESLDLLTPAEAADEVFPRWDVDAATARLIANGVRIDSPGFEADPVAVFGPDGALIALVEEHRKKVRSLAVFVHGQSLA
jgi:tRNA pseudouridine55 synthase